ncbi:MAG: energy transducer TonB [Candidatus Dactylopiibacterium carminicum]|uniref:Energy transducer TonB n=1 Tax=Candidatus Dactylopiibacterium carminicum TaxID=857335 RepID=A0A272EYX2_9RHOO|nr:energy transducer TonB [Candidatus Dactylopiibacterium carminicum]KAF7600823.1 energy transducer TonB [Candidatus Dactylopiibacterium carminicum]PAS95322.1 MAG: energy transducer TonB [Candidatus Dactylopiibacterium carminicum]PAS98666.1 MAG: energy transducer TonB [Candidatus Dactylopiibacterium carminicum]PAT00829.1 MAG: hypothetical protein BSR46_00270 [Candidatus Dactylopiibacterium carminicum]
MYFTASTPLSFSQRTFSLLAVGGLHLLAALGLMALVQPVVQHLAKPLRIDLVAAAPAPAGPPEPVVEAPKPLPMKRQEPVKPVREIKPVPPVPVTPPVIQAPPEPAAVAPAAYTAPPPPIDPAPAVVPEGGSGKVAPVAAGGKGGGGDGGAGEAEQGARHDADYLHNPKPQYPRASRSLGEEGTVWLRVQVSEAGRALQVLVDTSSGFSRLDRAAREAVANWCFEPARRGPQAVTTWVRIPIAFALDR